MSRLPVRSSVRPLLRAALAAWFAAHAGHAFSTGVGGRLAYGRAPRDWPRPYAVLDIPVALPRDTTTERIDAVTIQIMVYGPASLAVEELAGAALELFEGRVITGAGVAPFELWRGGDVPSLQDEDGVWMAGVQLSGLVETIA
ncbi:MAG TPA: hypothetical protein PKC79_20960 [Solidesulfovibrio magneticus]|nr:hypothetical protein [Solidesulfovibrio magneticus]